jgi:hypothetical protein
MLHVQSGAAGANQAPRENTPTGQPLFGLDEAAARALRCLTQDGENLVLALEARLDSLQEAFVGMLNSQLMEKQLRPEDRLHLSLSSDGTLVVEGNDNDTNLLCEIIARKPTLQKSFREMAQVAMLSHGVELVTQIQSDIADQDCDEVNPLLGRYHMCLKGSLSHFYVR